MWLNYFCRLDRQTAKVLNRHASSSSRRNFPRELSFCSSHFLPRERGSGAPYGAYVFISRSYGERTGPAKTGLALRRSTAAFEEPWCPTSLLGPDLAVSRDVREGLRDIDPRPHNGPGGFPPRSPGTTAANHGRGRRFPLTFTFTFSFASRTFLRRAGTAGIYSIDKI